MEINEAIIQLKGLISRIDEAYNGSIGLSIENSEEISIGTYISKGYANPTLVRNSKKVSFDLIKSTGPSDMLKIRAILQEMIQVLESQEKPKSRLKEALKKIAPYSGWLALANSILVHYHIL